MWAHCVPEKERKNKEKKKTYAIKKKICLGRMGGGKSFSKFPRLCKYVPIKPKIAQTTQEMDDKSCIRETLNVSTDADSSTDTIKIYYYIYIFF